MSETLTDEPSSVDGLGARPAVLLIATGGRSLVRAVTVARDGRATLGRALQLRGATLELDDGRASRTHAEVRAVGGRWRVRDLDSHNGTFVDGRRVTDEVTVDDGALVRTGASLFWLCADGAAARDDGVTTEGGVVRGLRSHAVDDAVRRAVSAPTLLILGASGTGKERLARSYHQHGPRAGGPFVPVNCAAIPEAIAERVLFGSRKGAYSGADDAPGYVSAAHGGTLFLDELGELDLALQAKLLRVLESREVWPVGATRGVPIELGLVAATHRDLRAAVAAGRFREDLYYRLTKPVVHVPALRERKDELPVLALRALAAVSPTLTLHPRLLDALCLRPWPGNVRELLHEVRAAADAAVAANAREVRLEHLAEDAGQSFAAPAVDAPDQPARIATRELDKDELVAAVAAAGGNVSAAARALGLHRTQLYRLLDRHGLARP
ncbi:MAG: sigma 54-interacting transcriptional regulator [Myxococcales bacterium]|nr:sigma 54-interacting transcriptional regulator [Myxococcales bacterium]